MENKHFTNSFNVRNWSKRIPVYLLLVFIVIISSALSLHVFTQPRENHETIALIERDTIQTRNFKPVINHQAMIINLSEHMTDIDILSPLPPEKYSLDTPFTAFGNDSMLGAPLFSPFKIPIKNHIILGKPNLKAKDKKVAFQWKNVHVPPGEAVVAQYDHYYGPIESFFRDYGLEIADLRIVSKYSAQEMKDNYRLTFSVSLQNHGKHEIRELLFRLFIPTSVYPEGKNEQSVLLEPVEVWASENADVSTSTIVDGFSRTARGIDASLQADLLKSGDSIECAVQMDCKKKAVQGKIYPIMHFLGRRELTRLWPPTVIEGKSPDPGKMFHYLLYNLVLSDRRILILDKKGITVRHVKIAEPDTVP